MTHVWILVDGPLHQEKLISPFVLVRWLFESLQNAYTGGTVNTRFVSSVALLNDFNNNKIQPKIKIKIHAQ